MTISIGDLGQFIVSIINALTIYDMTCLAPAKDFFINTDSLRRGSTIPINFEHGLELGIKKGEREQMCFCNGQFLFWGLGFGK